MRFVWRGRELLGDGRKIAEIVPDPDWPGMWRVRDLDGQLSDMVNLPRAKQAAITNARRAAGLGSEDSGA